MRLFLADDQIKVRSALRLLLEQEPDMAVVGEAADATGLLQGVAEKEPELVLLDWELPGLPSSQLLRLLQYERPSLHIIAMSSRPEVAHLALAAGAHRFLSKSEAPEQVLAIIRSLCSSR
ncbi:MAG: response regulator transcription factor [Ardenticatenaceae bacterium]|nr:response regulator transcription factor [Ardenticatenaceae bacterium]